MIQSNKLFLQKHATIVPTTTSVTCPCTAICTRIIARFPTTSSHFNCNTFMFKHIFHISHLLSQFNLFKNRKFSLFLTSVFCYFSSFSLRISFPSAYFNTTPPRCRFLSSFFKPDKKDPRNSLKKLNLTSKKNKG